MAETTKTTTASGGIGFSGLLTIVFIILKLTHVIDWSWGWVLSPLWISASLFIFLFIVIGIIVLRAANVAFKLKKDEKSL